MGLNWPTIDDTRAMVIWFEATGDVFITAQNVQGGPITQQDFYADAFKGVSSLDKDFAGSCQSVAVAKIEQQKPPSQITTPTPGLPLPVPKQQATGTGLFGRKKEGGFGFIEKILGTSPQQEIGSPAQAPDQGAKMRYAINLAPAGDAEPNIEITQVNGKNIATVIGRFYLWQKQDERGGLLEIQADAAVVYYSTRSEKPDEGASALETLTGTGAIESIYVTSYVG